MTPSSCKDHKFNDVQSLVVLFRQSSVRSRVCKFFFLFLFSKFLSSFFTFLSSSTLPISIRVLCVRWVRDCSRRRRCKLPACSTFQRKTRTKWKEKEDARSEKEQSRYCCVSLGWRISCMVIAIEFSRIVYDVFIYVPMDHRRHKDIDDLRNLSWNWRASTLATRNVEIF